MQDNKCEGCGGTNTFEKCGRMVGGTSSVPYKRLICKDCPWRGAMVEVPDVPKKKE